jgi:hypothetical protein
LPGGCFLLIPENLQDGQLGFGDVLGSAGHSLSLIVCNLRQSVLDVKRIKLRVKKMWE